MNNTGIILLTALVPTIGHKYLVDFADMFMSGINGRLHVIISTRSHEPTSYIDRMKSLYSEKHFNVFFHEHFDDNAPQNPSTSEEWAYWKNLCESVTKGRKVSHYFASEKYGHEMADLLGSEFIPVDIAREIFPVKGTSVRKDLFGSVDKISPKFVDLFHTDVVLFGPESCGKTTMAKRLAKDFNGQFVHEWARPYLEEIGIETTEQRMRNIVLGQHAAMKSAKDLSNKFFTFYDTDLLSTLGFYRLYGIPVFEKIYDYIHSSFNPMYIVMNDGIPFEEDILRYGGDKRESDRKFWIDLLKEYNREYYVVRSTDREQQVREISEVLMTRSIKKTSYKQIMEFDRD